MLLNYYPNNLLEYFDYYKNYFFYSFVEIRQMEQSILITIPLQDFVSTIEATVRKVLTEKNIEDDTFISSEQVMKLFNISTTTLQLWRDKNKIPFNKVGKKIFYSRNELMNLTIHKKGNTQATATV